MPLGNEDDDGCWSDAGVDPPFSYPRPQTAHVATVVGSQLVVHGGMGFSEHLNEWDGSTEWETLDDGGFAIFVPIAQWYCRFYSGAICSRAVMDRRMTPFCPSSSDMASSS